MKKIRFTVLHPAGTNVDLIKDEGQIPSTLGNIKNVDATIVSCHIESNAANMNSVPGLSVKHIPLIINNPITGIVYLFLNSKKIDWLNIYFAGRQAYIWMRLYRFLNRRGHIYLKLDLDFRGCDLYDSNAKERRIFKKNVAIADIVSVESKAVKERIQKYSAKELLIIEDGISKLNFKPVVNVDRDDIFITVGRLGTYQKATDILLEAFEKSSQKHNWKLKLIGNIQEDFKGYIEEFYEKYPDMRGRVIFTGSINDREALYSEYCHAKVFVLPSRWESFGISAAEALYCGCHLILSNAIPPAFEMTNDKKYGEIIKTENVEAWRDALIAATQKEYQQSEINEIVSYANKQFSWERICEKLFLEMNKIMEENSIE